MKLKHVLIAVAVYEVVAYFNNKYNTSFALPGDLLSMVI